MLPALAVPAIYSNLKPSAKDLVHKVHKYMEEVSWKLIEDVTEAFPRLKAAMKALVSYSFCRSALHQVCSFCVCLEVDNVVFL